MLESKKRRVFPFFTKGETLKRRIENRSSLFDEIKERTRLLPSPKVMALPMPLAITKGEKGGGFFYLLVDRRAPSINISKIKGLIENTTKGQGSKRY